MKLYNYSKFIILLLITTMILINSMGCFYKPLTKTSQEFSDLINQGNFDNLNLTIYYLSPFIYTQLPLSNNDLVEKMFEYKVIISGKRLEKHIDLLKQLNNVELKQIENESYIDARLYYMFETKKDGVIFSVSMWGKDNSMFVNGVEIEENDIFYDVVMPFLPEDAVQELKTYLHK